MNLFLTAEELADLTDAAMRSKQIEWLTSHGWIFEVSRLGNPKVLRAYAEARLGLATSAPAGRAQPNFAVLKKAG